MVITRVTDVAGNTSTGPGVAVSVDTTAPQSAFSSPAEGSLTTVQGKASLSGATNDALSGTAGAEMSLDNGKTWFPLTLTAGSWSYTWDTSDVPNGKYTILVRAADVAGNQEHTAQVTLVVSNASPQPIVKSANAVVVVPTATPTVTPTPTAIPSTTPTAEPPAPAATPAAAYVQPSAPQSTSPRVSKPLSKRVTVHIDPIYFWPAIALLGFLGIVSAAVFSDNRPRAIKQLSATMDRIMRQNNLQR